MEDNESTEVVENTTPAEDPILSTLSDTEDESPSEPVVETPSEEVSEAETEPEVEQPKEDDSEDQVVDPKEEARRRYEERQTYRAEQMARIKSEVSDPYVNDATDEQEQRIRNIEARDYERLVENTQDKLVSEFERAKVNPDLQIFNPDSDQFNQKIYDKAMRDYNSGYITYDTNGQMVGLKSSLYEHLNETAELYQGARKSGQFQQVKDSRQMKSKADVKPAASPKEITKDPILDILKSD